MGYFFHHSHRFTNDRLSRHHLRTRTFTRLRRLPTLIGPPILTTILAIPLLGEIPTTIQWVGGAIALAGIYIVNQSHLQTQEKVPNA
jgi:hypothetical protein